MPGCYHCGAPIPAGVTASARIDGVDRPMCCHGCAAVALLLSGPLTPPVNIARNVDADAGMLAQDAAVSLDGITCSSCAWLIEHRLNRLPGIVEARVDVVRKRLNVSWDGARLSLPAILGAVRGLGYGARPADVADATPARRELQRVLVAALCMMQVMMLSVPVYMSNPGDIAPDLEQLLRIAQWLLSVPVLIFCAWPIWRGAWRDARLLTAVGRVGMDLTVAFGLLVATGASIWSVLRGAGPVYFDSITMFVSLLLASRWLQGRGLARATDYLDALARRSVPNAWRLTGWPASLATEAVPADQLRAGDLIQIRPGESFPADGVVVDGAGHCSEALLTGESAPLMKRIGDAVLASGVNLDQPLIMRAERVGGATALAALTRLADAAARERPALVEFADRAARWFMFAVLLLVLLAAAVWAWIDPTRIVPVTVAILIVTCPCALSLAVPAALAAAQAALARRGVLVTRAAAIEVLGRVDHVVFDKTGTLTQGRMRLVSLVVLRGGVDADAALRLATALDGASNHPVAQALRAASSAVQTSPDTPLPRLRDARMVNGQGAEATVDGARLRFGNVAFAIDGVDAALRDGARQILASLGPSSDSVSVLADSAGVLAVLRFADPLRADAPALLQQLRERGLALAILSGDRPEAVKAVADALGISAMQAAASPEDKRASVRAMQARGQVVAMVGDGLNDAPVIAQADVSAAFASASTLAQTRADFVVLSDSFDDLGHAFELSARALRIVRQNLGWALAYNLIAIPVAASGSVAPVLAGAGMALSSLLVVGNALRLLPGRRAPASSVSAAAPDARNARDDVPVHLKSA